MSAPRVLLCVSAESGAGKTTLLERLIPELGRRGVCCAVVKLTHHDVDPDPPGKDSGRLRDAGARGVVLAGPRRATLCVPGRQDIARLAHLAAAVGDVDLVLVEGGRAEPDLPRIEVVAPGGRLATTDPALLVAVAADADVAPPGTPRFARDAVPELADLVADWARRAAPSP